MPALSTDTPADTAPDSAPVASGETSEAPNFSFRIKDRKFSAWVQNDANGPEVCLACEIGGLPYSAENRDGRRAALTILSASGTFLASVSSRLMLSDFHKISLLTTAKIADAEDLRGIVAAAAAGVLTNLPLIELMEKSMAPTATAHATSDPAA